MTRFLRLTWPIATFAALLIGSMSACEDDVEDTTSTGTPTTASSGGGGATTTSTGGGGTSTTSTGGGGTGGVGGGIGGGGMGGIPIPNTGMDTCPGDPYTLNVGDTLYLAGDTTNAADDYQGAFCQNKTTGADLVYAITLAGAGSLKIQARSDDGSSLNPTMFSRPDGLCDDSSNNAYYGCWGFFNTHEEFSFDQPGPETFYIFIDGQGPTAGPFTLLMSLLPPACGDGVTNSGESCDDGNNVNGDGCSGTCTFENITLFDDCDGDPHVLGMNSPTAFSANNTTGYSDDKTAQQLQNCNGSPPQPNGKDRMHEIIAQDSGTVTVKIGYDTTGMLPVCEEQGLFDPGCWDYTLYAIGPNNCPTGPQIACAEQTQYAPEQISFPVVAGESYTVVVDGYEEFESFGSYNLHMQWTP